MSQSVSALLSAVFLLALAGTTIQQISRSNPVTATSAPSSVPAPAPDTTAVEKRPAAPSVDEVMLPPPPTIEPPPPTTQSTPMAEPKATILPLRPTQSVEPLPLLVVPLLPTAEPASRISEGTPALVAERPALRQTKISEEEPRRPLVPLKPTPRPVPLAPEPVTAIKPIESDDRHLERLAEPLEAPRAPEIPVSVETVGKEIVVKGRALLRLLEHGKGPVVEIAWPDAAGERERLFSVLRDCFDLKMALIDMQGRLFLADGERGRPSGLNLDRYSGFVRQIDRSMSVGADAEERQIRDRHAGLPAAQRAFLLPRVADALLLGGLRHLVGAGYEGEGSIRARYVLAGGRLLIEDVAVGKRAVPGVIDLTGAGRRPCARL